MVAELQITVNGQPRATKSGATVVDLLRDLGLESGRVAIERNRNAPGDRYEIVHFVGGG
jgi:sulfur carrier protein ThiS